MKPLELLTKGLIPDGLGDEIEAAVKLVKSGHKDIVHRLDTATDYLETVAATLNEIAHTLKRLEQQSK